MEVQGRIIHKLPLTSGTSAAGRDWQKQEYVLETVEAYPKKIHFDFFGERVSQYPLEVGDFIELSFDIESREYNGRWYTNIRGWKAEKRDPNQAGTVPPPADPFAGNPAPVGQPAAPAQPAAQGPAPAAPATDFNTPDGGENLPF